jgi:cytochrome c5
MSNMTDRDFAKNFSLMIGSLIVLAVVLFIIAQIIGGKPEATKTSSLDKDVIARIEPVGKLTVAQAVANTVVPGAQAADGAAVYNEVCMACHNTGAANAPKLGDKAAWAPRIAQGKDTLYKHALQGLRAMPPKGGRADKSDADIKAAVDYIVSKAK